ncbi:thiamine pyrophosphate-dependent enzyme [Alkalibaculum bacchi]|uniref:alpha-ketoacid dehydrogenase subunit alpha/beta n=1 Tax=Alkalibaculum bacchi TaxID=645887 RepID=UPI0026EA6F5E|nr:alpha-ketoacid dehydrogenase subunit alpha/beta [Alkalibaculum bacchi]
MPKNINIDPVERRKPGELTFKPIQLNQYQKRVKDVKDEYTKEELIHMYRDMILIREFETMLQDLRATGEYRGTKYSYTGPAHLYLGQEATAVGQSFILGKEDLVFGNHRSHGELIAKGMSALEKLEDKDLMEIMEKSHDGAQLRVVEKGFKGSVKELATRFYIYGIATEILGRKNGFAQGLGNSMHAFFIPFGVYPNNAIVGGSAPVALGAALYRRVNKQDGIIIANAGDGSLGCGPVWESMNMAAMDQLTQLWDEAHKGGLPILFNFNNNGYGMGGQTVGETMAYNVLARVGAGISPTQLHAERVDGYNPLAVIDAMKRKKEILVKGEGPALLDVVTYRIAGHSTSDANPYRSKEELEAWKNADAILSFRNDILEAGMTTEKELDEVKEAAETVIEEVFKLSIDDSVSPRMDLMNEADSIEKYMFSNEKIPSMDTTREPDVLGPKEENTRVKRIAKKERAGIKDGKTVPSVKAFQFRDAVFEALMDKFYEDPTLISFGEDLRDWGGAYGVYKNMEESIPYHRLFNTPISESAIVGAAVGYAMLGGRSVPELMYCDFMGRAGDEIFNQLAKWQSMTAGQLKMPVVLRTSVGAKYGAQHSQDWTSLCAHIPGLKVVFPATPYDAKGLMNAALKGSDPVVFFESQRLYGVGEMFHEGGVPEEYYEIPLGEPDIKRVGTDLTILSIGATLYKAIEAAERLEKEYGLSVEVIDARSVVPFNFEPVIESVKKTGRILLTSDACQRNSILNDFAQNISELAFDYLDAPPVVVGSRNWITPIDELEEFFFPQADTIIDAVHEKIVPLAGHKVKFNHTKVEQIRRYKFGV